MFLWLLHLNRLWCNDRLQRRGWPNGYFCPLCMRNLESSVHLIWDCPTAMQVWSTAATWGRCSALHPDVWTEGPTTSAKVGMIIDAAAPAARRGTKSMIALISWRIWMERNDSVFKGKTPSTDNIIRSCRSDMEQWRIAGAACLEHPFGHVP